MTRSVQWGIAAGLSVLVALSLWWWTRSHQTEDELQRSHLALVLPMDLDGGEVPDVVMVYARLTQDGSSLVEAVRGEDQSTLWSTEVAGMGVAETRGVRAGSVDNGVIALASRRPDGAEMKGQITVLEASSGVQLWEDSSLPELCEGFWSQVSVQGNSVVAFCRTDSGHALRVYEDRSGTVRWELIRPGEILETGPVFLTGMVFLPDPVHGRWLRLDGKGSDDFLAPGQVYVDTEHVVYTRRDEECASKFRLERLNRAGQSEILALVGEDGCLPEGISPFRPLGWSPGLLVGLDDTGGLIGVSEGSRWRLDFPDGFHHRGRYYEHKRRAAELSALHELPGPYHPFILRKQEGGVELVRLAIVDLESGILSWQSEPVKSPRPWVSMHILKMDERFLIILPGGEHTRLLVLDAITGTFTDAVELKAENAGMSSSVLSRHLLELHLYPERFSGGQLFGSARDRVFSVNMEDWNVVPYRGEPISVEASWKPVGELLGDLPRSP